MDHKDTLLENGYVFFNYKWEAGDHTAQDGPPIDTHCNVIILCHRGEATVVLNMKTVTLRAGDCLCVPNMLYMRTVNISNDFHAQVIACDMNYAIESIVGIPSNYMNDFNSITPIHVNDNDVWTLLVNYFENMHLLQGTKLGIKHKEATACTFRAIVILLAGLNVSANTAPQLYTQSDVYLRDFLRLIDRHVKQEHEVAFYADKLHITAKYLSEICKNKSGRKAKEVISFFLLSRLKREILVTGKSIKQIAYEYGFADQSSLGKFFTKMTGQSPSSFKNSNSR